MSIEACAELVQRGDPDRFLSAMTAPSDQRGALMVLYAFNLEVARAPWVTKESIIAEMHLQWWRDAIAEIYDGNSVRRHEVVTPLAEVIVEQNLPRKLLDVMIDARRWDIYPEPHRDQNAFDTYVRNTGGNLMLLGCLALDAELNPQQLEAVRDFGFGVGVAAMLQAVPTLNARGRVALFDESPTGIAALAERALKIRRQARPTLKSLPAAISPALRAGWLADGVLRRAKAKPHRVELGQLEPSPVVKKLNLLWKSAIGGF